MVALSGLWLPILVSAVVVFVASSVMHMILPYHRKDYGRMPEEEKILLAMREAGLKPGQYLFPFRTHEEMKSPEMMEKYKVGPVGMMTVIASGPTMMGKYLAMWFGYCLMVGFFVAYLTGTALGAGAAYLVVFRVAGMAAFLAYGVGQVSNGIWRGQPWGVTLKEAMDGLVYGMLTAGTFGWLWPRG
jgi:hypothetical protein